jgi:hypothetical protein
MQRGTASASPRRAQPHHAAVVLAVAKAVRPQLQAWSAVEYASNAAPT